jgi:hypothetical protein
VGCDRQAPEFRENMDSYRNEVKETLKLTLADHTELFKQFSDNPGFKKWLSDTIFGVTYEEAGM